jgi:HlyD family secretion protein
MKKKIIIGASLVILIAAIIAANIIKNTGAVSAFSGGSAVEIKVNKIEKGNISAAVSASGTIEEIDKQEIYFDTPLKVKKILVENNQKVTKGQQLVELDMDDLNSQLEQEKVNKSLQELGMNKLRPGKGSAADNNVKSAESSYNDAKSTYEKNQTLFNAQSISQNELDRSKKAFDDAEIALRNARLGVESEGIDVSSQGQNLRAADLKIAGLETKIKKILDSSVSPIDGVISDINIVAGGFTSNAQPAFKVVNPEKLKITADVKEFDIKKVAVGQKVNITGDAIDKSDGVTGVVTSISPVAKTNTTASGEETLIGVVISIVKGIPVLKPGLSVTCDIIYKEDANVLITSFETLREDKDGNKSVLVFDQKAGILHEKKIKLGVTSDLSAEVIEGINEGDLIVSEPQPNVKEGTRAKLAKEAKK